jgi:spermidine/putrescine transport system substrate-binding protein
VNRRLFLLGLPGLAGCGRGLPRLNVYNWSNYVASDTVSNFESEFGVHVRYATYEGNEEMMAKVLSGNSGWDIVFPTHNRILPMRQ